MLIFRGRVFFCVLIFFYASCFSACAYAQAAAFFSGHVTDSQGNPIAGVTVQAGYVALGMGGWTFFVKGEAVSDVAGNYSMAALPSEANDAYIVAAKKTGYLVAVYPNLQCGGASCLENPNLPAYPAQADTDFSMLLAGSIAGRVTRADTGAPIAFTIVSVFGGDGNISSDINTDADGNFKIDGLRSGGYALLGSPNNSVGDELLPQAYALHDYDVTTTGDSIYNALSLCDLVTLAEGQSVSDVNFTLDAGQRISGTTTSAINGAPVNVFPTLLRLNNSNAVDYTFTGISSYDDQGGYKTVPLVPGSFLVKFQEGDEYLPLFFPQAATEDGAHAVTLAAGHDTTGIDAQVTPTRSISGTVTDAITHLPLSGITVNAGAYFFWLSPDASGVTDASGHYLLQGLQAQNYYLWADSAGAYQPQFYGDAQPCCANPVLAGTPAYSLGDTELATGLDFAMDKGAYASGRIYDPVTNAAVTGAYVQLYDSTGKVVGPTEGSGFPAMMASDQSGHYTSAAVPNGNYYLLMSYQTHDTIIDVVYPNSRCTFSAGCNFLQGQLVQFSSEREYPGLDFAIPNFDFIFHGGFEP